MGSLPADSGHDTKIEEGLENATPVDDKLPPILEDSMNPADQKNEKQQAAPYWKLYRYADALDIILIVVGSLAAILNGLTLPVMFYVQNKLINAFGTLQHNGDELYKEATKYAIIFVYVSIASGITSYLENSCWMCTGERQSGRIRAKYLRAILRQNVGYFDSQSSSTAKVVNTVSADTSLVQEAMSEKVGNYLQNMAQFLGGYTVSFFLVWRLALVTLPFLPLLLIPGALYKQAASSLALRMRTAYNKAGVIAEQSISSVRTVYSFVGEESTVKAYSEALDDGVQLGMKQGLAKGLAVGSVGINFAIWSFMAWYGSVQVIDGHANGGQVLITGFLLLTGGVALGNATQDYKAFSEGCAAVYRIFQLIERVPPIDADDMNGKTLEKVEGSLELRNVDFAYPTRENAPVLQNFCLQIPAGKTVALVGSSGSGKSTIIALLERFYDPSAGEVLIDGINIKDLQLKWLRRQIGLVSQEPALFATSIKENILYGKDDASMDEFIAAAKSANAFNFIEQLPEGFNTQVGERGVQMSGGQKQRIAIARAMLKNPPVLLLDEATSALDVESEKVVQQALENAAAGRTTVVVAHRLSTICNADTIVVIQSGKVLEMGSHEDLLSRQGGYASLIHLQHARPEDQASFDNELQLSSKDSNELPCDPQELIQNPNDVADKSNGHSSRLGGVKTAKVVDTACETGVGERRKPQVPSMRRLLALNKPEWKQAVLGIIGAIGFGFVQPIYAYVIGDMAGSFFGSNHDKLRHDVRLYSAVFVALFVMAFTVNVLQHYNFAALGEHLTKRIRVQMLTSIFRFEVGWFDRDENASGAICSRLAMDSRTVRSLVGDRLSLLVQTVSAIGVSFILGLVILWKLALVVIAVQPLMVFSYYIKKTLLTKYAKGTSKAQQGASQVASEAVAQHRTVTAFSAQDKVLALFEMKLDGPRREMMKRSQVAGAGLGVASFCLFASWGVDFWYGGLLTSKGEATFTQVLKVFFILVSSGRILAEAGTLTSDIAKGTAAISSVFEILDRKTQMESDSAEADKVEKVEGNIEVRNIRFAYPSRPDVMVFNNFSLTVMAGSTVAMVGQSGSGKSTIIGLIERFYDPLEGVVLIDGKDIRTVNLHSLRSHIGLVSQEPTLFAGTLRENIAYGKIDATDAEIIEASRAANVHNFISALPNGYDTYAGEQGLQLSGGQKQRIAIARAVLKNPAILLLDEATSALDAASERVVQDALDRMMVRRTTIVVAHRLSTIQNADTIAVLKTGAILEQGCHEDLMAKGMEGAYYSLVRLQTRHQ